MPAQREPTQIVKKLRQHLGQKNSNLFCISHFHAPVLEHFQRWLTASLDNIAPQLEYHSDISHNLLHITVFPSSISRSTLCYRIFYPAIESTIFIYLI